MLVLLSSHDGLRIVEWGQDLTLDISMLKGST